MHNIRTAIFAAVLAAFSAPVQTAASPPPIAADAAAWIAACADNDEWDKPGPPFRIHGNSWYVGTCGITAILVASSRGHVLIDSGTETGAAIVAANIQRLGFRLSDVKILLHSHEHFDHVGGMAVLQRRTGAQLIASEAAAPALATGHDSPGDPQAGMHPPFAAASVARTVSDGESVRLGALALTAHATPGHTPGALTWSWISCRGARRDCRTIVYADSLNPISSDSYRFTDHPAYLAAFRTGLSRLAALRCDILLTPHPGASAMHDRLGEGGLGSAPGQCRAYAQTISARLEARLARENGASVLGR